MSEQKEQNEVLEEKAEELEEALKQEQNDEVTATEKEAAETEDPAAAEEENPEVPTEAETAAEESEDAEVSEVAEESEEDLDVQIAKLKKNDAAMLLIKKAKHIVHDAEAQMEACKLLLSDDLKDFEDAKKSLIEGGMEESEELLEALGFAKDEEEEEEVEEVSVFEAKEEVPPVHIRDISSGKFTGFLLALIFGLSTLFGLLYVATEKLGITLDLSKAPSGETISSILIWFSSLVDMKEPIIGGAMLIGTVLLVMFIVYKIRVSVRASSNLEYAKEQLKKAEEYASVKGSCKDEMDKVDAHIKEAIETMKTYEVILHEQKGKLRRIQHIEQSGEETPEYHEKSLKEMEETYDLIKTIKEFLNTPMSEEGKLSGKSTLFLYRAKNRLEKMIDRLY
ncbi:hypothetical protein [Sulfurovum riftiae]|uniref:Uncharacterized protein n=1 Tax=Sulfurovum riftiae TaxID=1630136 RepID=A0A151CGA8_9BACT|nr:hypothetical protein [Sulfurovum riftiae]KYJ86519.1 hypothetical protein AS592_06860 [Sulfurovum riftiae]